MHPLLAAVILAASLTATYLFCVRPTLRGRGCCPPTAADAGRQEELARLRAELDALRHGPADDQTERAGDTR